MTEIKSKTQSADFNLKILWPLARYVEDKYGFLTLEQIAGTAGINALELDGRNFWASTAQLETFLEEVRKLCSNDESFRQACVHRIREAYGAMRFVLWATTPGVVYKQAAKTYHLVCSTGNVQVPEQGTNRLVMHITSTQPVSRLQCISRQAQTAALATLWGLPPAILREEACIAKGDSACIYHLRWYDKPRWLSWFLGVIVGIVFSLIGKKFNGLLEFFYIYPPILGAAIGYIYESYRTGKANEQTRIEATEALRQIAAEEAEARREIMALNQRQQEWNSMLQNETIERTTLAKSLVERMQMQHEVREVTLRGFSHDLRSPLSVIGANVLYLRNLHNQQTILSPEDSDLLDDLSLSVERMSQMLSELMQTFTSQTGVMHLSFKALDLTEIAEKLRSRLRALAYGKDIRTGVLCGQELPASFEMDPLLFDRVLDNLLTNAVKYTQRGSIIIEVSATEEHLVFKISDTGRGIAPEVMERTFMPGGSNKETRAKNSFGVGLSVVVQLLAQIGGHLDVKSKMGEGTTFWIYFPLQLNSVVQKIEQNIDPTLSTEFEHLVNKVVTVRNADAA